MKKNLLRLISLSFLFTIFSCSNNIVMNSVSGDKVTVNFELISSYARTALPQDVCWENFKYTLVCNSNEELTKVDYDDLVLQLEKGSYSLTLTAYDGVNDILSGTASVTINDSWTNQKIPFFMVPKTGHTGNVAITLQYPSDVVKRIEAFITDDFTANTGTAFSTPTVLRDGEVVFTKSDLSSGVPHYAFFRLYNAETGGDCVASYLESIVIVGGATSTKTISVAGLSFHAMRISLQKDGSAWVDSGKMLVLIDENNTAEEMILTDRNGNFTKTAKDGEYKIYIKNIGENGNGIYTGRKITCGSSNNVYPLNFKTTLVPSNASDNPTQSPDAILTPVSLVNGIQGDTYNQFFVAEDTDGLEFTVQIKPGYDASTVQVGSQVVNNGATVTVIPGAFVQVANNLPLNNYNISFNPNGGIFNNPSSWNSVTYNVENYESVQLPKKGDITNGSNFFDGWACGNDAFSKIPAGTTGDLSLNALWKDGVYIDKTNHIIYARGFDLTIEWDSTVSTKTVIKYTESQDPIGSDDFSGYKLYADYEPAANKHTGSEFTFTITGGNISHLEGLGTIKPSTINISGSPIIGNGRNDGLILNSITNEMINIVGQMSGDYSLSLITTHEFEKGKALYKLAYIYDADYAQIAKFKCLNSTKSYEEEEIGIMNGNGSSKIIYLRDTNPISLPPASSTPGVNEEGGIIWLAEESGYSSTYFTLGNSANIGLQCSVFSVFVENGSFQLTTRYQKNATGQDIVTDNLAHDSVGNYYAGTNIEIVDASTVTSSDPTLSQHYTYFHMLSQSNEITPESTTEFLKSIVFRRENSTIPITLNIKLETVPYAEIAAMNSTYGNKFKYYDGSFYVSANNTTLFGSSSTTWTDAYNKAKTVIFNGLNGYLATLTSKVEFNYLYSPDGLQAACGWIGGARYTPSNGWDQSTFTIGSTSSLKDLYWVAGPEAGMKFYTVGSGPIDGRFSQWQGGGPSVSQGGSQLYGVMYHNGGNMCLRSENGSKGAGSTPTDCIIEFRPYTKIWNPSTNQFDIDAPNPQKANYPSIVQTASY